MKEFLFHIDWEELFIPQMSLPEIFIRATLVYITLLVLMRLLRRQSGQISISDLLVIVILGNAAQNAIVADTVSVTDGLLLSFTIISWNYALDYLGMYSVGWRRFIHPLPRLLVKDGKLIRSNMRRELITDEELMSKLHEEGVDNVSKVKEAYLEGDGQISVIKRGK